MKREVVTSALGILILTLMLGLAYPLLVTGVSQLAFPGNANGQLIRDQGRVVGSKIIGQNFGGNPRYFQSRPSATTPPNNAAATTFSNLGPNNVATEKEISANISAYLKLNRPYDSALTRAEVPVDAANTSGSGIDPGISVANADIQAHRVAAVRRLPMAEVTRLIRTYTHGRGLGFSGEPGVDVLELNLALERLT
ncbi:MAG: potassium-transporting ATPase subunit KdpC [Solirubrobacterales bacterium]|nr:potassium-transporting ATPase subunit KdpC [Solirubrobacterales bacterium]MBV9716685.1 potassium-transporting ATPase subunit KdpC [Solirubrobacterales bacterium]